MIGDNGNDTGDWRVGDSEIDDAQIGNWWMGDGNPSQVLSLSSSLRILGSENKSLKLSSSENLPFSKFGGKM